MESQKPPVKHGSQGGYRSRKLPVSARCDRLRDASMENIKFSTYFRDFFERIAADLLGGRLNND
jgi:hypothetical protein